MEPQVGGGRQRSSGWTFLDDRQGLSHNGCPWKLQGKGCPSFSILKRTPRSQADLPVSGLAGMSGFSTVTKPYCIKTKRPIAQGHLPPACPTPCGGGAGMDGPPRADEQASASARHWVALPPSARYPARPPASPEPSGVGRGRGVSPMLPAGHLPVVNPFVDSLSFLPLLSLLHCCPQYSVWEPQKTAPVLQVTSPPFP